MPINRAFQRLKKPMKDGFLLIAYTIYSGDSNGIPPYIANRNEVSTINDTWTKI